MTTIVVGFTNSGAPATGLAATIRIRRADTQALVVTDAAMTEQGDGAYSFDFAPVDGVEYSIRADGSAALSIGDRHAFGSLSGTTEARIEADIPAIVSDVASIQASTVDLDAALSFLGAVIGSPVTHTPTTVASGGYTWAVAVVGPNVTFTRLT